MTEEKPDLGFTGTQTGMTDSQFERIYMWRPRFVRQYQSFHHGDCIGADEEAFTIFDGYLVTYSHPPDIDTKRAFTRSDHVFAAKPYLDRNRDIVDAVALMLATPKGFKEVLRSGTWATIRYALRIGKPVVIVWPDGTYERR